jgi:hypothetical protein
MHENDRYTHQMLHRYEYTNVLIQNIPATFNLRKEFEKIGEVESVRDDGECGYDN